MSERLVDVRIPRDDLHPSSGGNLLHELRYQITKVTRDVPASGPEVELTLRGVEPEALRRALQMRGVSVLAIREREPRPSLVRRAIDLLLAAYPESDIVWVETQGDEPPASTRLWSGSTWLGLPLDSGPWVLVKLSGQSRPFAIWKTTGAVYREDEDGAVEDDPFIEVEPDTSSTAV